MSVSASGVGTLLQSIFLTIPEFVGGINSGRAKYRRSRLRLTSLNSTHGGRTLLVSMARNVGSDIRLLCDRDGIARIALGEGIATCSRYIGESTSINVSLIVKLGRPVAGSM